MNTLTISTRNNLRHEDRIAVGVDGNRIAVAANFHSIRAGPLHEGRLHEEPLHEGPLHEGPLHEGPLHEDYRG